jgi:hypothetical protein
MGMMSGALLQGIQGAAVAALSLQPVSTGAAHLESSYQILDLAAEQRLVMSLEPITFDTYAAVGSMVGEAVAGGLVPRAAMLHGFQLTCLDSAGQRVDDCGWEVAVLVRPASAPAGAGPHLLAALDGEAPQLNLAKPLGYRVEAGDSLLLRLTTHGAAGRRPRTRLVVTMDYEPLDGPVSRLPVVLLHASGSVAHCAAAPTACRTWEWSPAASGRMLALTGPALEGATELVLEDADSGLVLWRTTTPPHATRYAQPSPVARPGVAVRNGGIYRLTAVYESAAAVANGRVVAMVLPGRAVEGVAMR